MERWWSKRDIGAILTPTFYIGSYNHEIRTPYGNY